MTMPLFRLGRLVATPNAMRFCASHGVNVAGLLARHQAGDDGDLTPEDKASNANAIVTGEDRVFSSYNIGGAVVWIITEWDRSVTTVLLPEDY